MFYVYEDFSGIVQSITAKIFCPTELRTSYLIDSVLHMHFFQVTICNFIQQLLRLSPRYLCSALK